MTIWIYRLLFLPALLVASPYYIFRMIKRGGYGRDFSQRLGLFPRPPLLDGTKKRLWIHCVSVGEAQSIRPLVDRLIEDGQYQLVITTTTSTGYGICRKLYSDRGTVGLFPLDFWPCSWLAWRRIRPDCVLLVDSELWPEHLFQARRRRVPVILVNARLSDRSYRRCCKIRRLARRLWSSVDLILASSLETVHRLQAIGVVDEKLRLVGNIKCDRESCPLMTEDRRRQWLEDLGICDGAPGLPILFGCSTWPQEEEFLLDVFRRIRAIDPAWRLIITPRHVERSQEIQRILSGGGLRFHLRSQGPAKDQTSDAAIVDTTGELGSLIALGTLAFLGKSLPPNGGGQSPLDAVNGNVALVSGPNMSNFREMVSELESCGGIVRADDRECAEEALVRLSQNPQEREAMVAAAASWLSKSRGAIDRICDSIQAALARPPSAKK